MAEADALEQVTPGSSTASTRKNETLTFTFPWEHAEDFDNYKIEIIVHCIWFRFALPFELVLRPNDYAVTIEGLQGP